MDAEMKTAFARKPKQTRSRQSYDRMLDAATHILEEGGLPALTLSEVSRRSKVSIGSIYCRVDGKDDLLRAVQERALGQMDREFALLLMRVRRRVLPLRELVPTVVRELANFLRRHARLLSAFMQQAAHDPVIQSAGAKSWQQTALDFELIILERRDEFGHPDPDHAAHMCFLIVYGCLARFLGFNSLDARAQGLPANWDELIDDLGLMMLGFLALDLKSATGAPGRKSRPAGQPSK
jgi:AcrR family transcriptional regulator